MTPSSASTASLLAEEGGFLYDLDPDDDELPYWTNVGGKPYLIVPYTHTTNDTKFGLGVMATGGDFFDSAVMLSTCFSAKVRRRRR